jgi:hypothetical protein
LYSSQYTVKVIGWKVEGWGEVGCVGVWWGVVHVREGRGFSGIRGTSLFRTTKENLKDIKIKFTV